MVPTPGFALDARGPCDRAPVLHSLAAADSLLTGRHFPEALAAYAELRPCADSSGTPDSLSARFHRDYGWALARCDSMEAAGRYLSRALADWTAVAGDSSAGFGIALERYARWTAAAGDFDAAHRDFLRAWGILVATLGPDDRETLWAEHGLAQTLDHARRRDEALTHIAHVHAVRRRTLPADDLDLAWTCHDYALILHALGRLPQAEELYRQAYEARRDRLPGLSCETGWGYALCLAAEGDFQEALQVITEVGETIRHHSELEPALSVGTTATAANIAMRLGDSRGVERIEARFHDLVRRYGVDELTWNRHLPVHAYVLEHAGHLQAAVDTLHVRLRGLRTSYGGDSPLTVPVLARLADLEARLGHAALADSVFQEGLATADPAREPALFGSLAADYVRFLTERGQLAAAEPWAEAALRSAALLPAAHVVRSKVDEAVGRLRIAQEDPGAAWEFAHRSASACLHRYRLNLQAMSADQISAYWMLETAPLDLLLTLLSEGACESRAFVEAAWTLTIASRGSLLDELTRRREQGEEPDTLRTLKRRLAGLLTLDPVEGLEPVSQAQLRGMESAVAEIEERIAASRPGAPSRSTLTVEALRNGLPSRATLLAYVQYRRRGVPHYGAFLLDPVAGARFQDLGEGGAIDSLLARYQRLMAQAPEELILDPEGAESAYRRVGASLRELLLDPVFGECLPPDLVHIPTGPLWDVNVLTLPRASAAYLVEELTSHRVVQSERELIVPATSTPGRGLLAVGGVDYTGWTSDAPAPLPGSREEAEHVLALWRGARPGDPAELLTGRAAQEGILPDRLAGRRVLHLATHGVNWEDPLTGAPAAGLRLVRPDAGPSGLDGVWSEREVALEDLSSVELVFLSSCRSIEGTALSGERVAGLYRAFRLAGVRGAVLSAWAVGDRPGRDWCLRFYDRYLRPGGTANDAAFHTSSEILQLRRSTGRPTHPYYWGCFLAVGN